MSLILSVVFVLSVLFFIFSFLSVLHVYLYSYNFTCKIRKSPVEIRTCRPLMVLVAIQSAYIGQCTVFVHLHLVYVSDSATCSFPFRFSISCFPIFPSCLRETVFAQGLYLALVFRNLFKFDDDATTRHDIFVWGKSQQDTSSFGPCTTVFGTRIPRQGEIMPADILKSSCMKMLSRFFWSKSIPSMTSFP